MIKSPAWWQTGNRTAVSNNGCAKLQKVTKDVYVMKTETENQDSQTTLNVLDSFLVESGQKIITKEQVMMILDSLANSDDSSLVNRFPVVLAICARRGLELNSQALFGKYWETSPKRQNLD